MFILFLLFVCYFYRVTFFFCRTYYFPMYSIIFHISLPLGPKYLIHFLRMYQFSLSLSYVLYLSYLLILILPYRVLLLYYLLY